MRKHSCKYYTFIITHHSKNSTPVKIIQAVEGFQVLRDNNNQRK